MPLFHRRRAAAASRGDAGVASHEDDDLAWRSYDSVAETYARFADARHGPAAARVVELLAVTRGATVLDVGTGTGVAARLAAGAAGPDGTVVGTDPSLPMLREASARGGGPRYVAAATIDLPFRDASIGFVSACFVISHFPSYRTALFDVLRVLRAGGRLGVATWAAGERDDDLSRAWQEILERHVEHEMLSDALSQVAPWEERFSDPTALKDALHEAGLRDIWLEKMSYRIESSAEDYLASREAAAAGRFARHMLDAEAWEALREEARRVFASRFPPVFHDFHEAIVAVGHKP